MSKIAQYLQEHLVGEVTDAVEVRRHFAHDASILQLPPSIVVFPRGEEDIRKTARFSWQLAERGRILPITARGGGTDTSGAAIGNGILLVLPTHLNRILALDPKKAFVSVEPGISYDKLQQTLYTHGLFLPVYPSSGSSATVGGGIGNNAVGEKSVKYGNTEKYVQNLRVVLANGEVIETSRLSKRELSHKMGLSTFEGQVYRQLDGLLEESAHVLSAYQAKHLTKFGTAGYNLASVKNKDGFDLTPLFIGSQGTLGIISEATLSIKPHNPVTTLVMLSLHGLNDLSDLLPEILKLKPSMVDMVNQAALAEVSKLNPQLLANSVEMPSAEVHLFVEFDDQKDVARSKCVKDLARLVEKYNGVCRSADSMDEQQHIIKVRQSVSAILTHPHAHRQAVPIAEDICVPIEHVVDYMRAAAKLYIDNDLVPAMWGPIGSGVVRMQPALDIANLGDRQKIFRLSEALYSLAINMGGSMSAGSSDGRMRAPYLKGALGEEMYLLTMAVKRIFDPYKMLNAGVKATNLEDIKQMMRAEYTLGHRHEHLPRS